MTNTPTPLLPCPFCGSDETIVDTGTMSHGGIGYMIECNNDDCDWRYYWDTLKEAERVWNARAIPEGYALVPIFGIEALHQKPVYANYERQCGYLDCLNDIKTMISAAQKGK